MLAQYCSLESAVPILSGLEFENDQKSIAFDIYSPEAMISFKTNYKHVIC